MRRVWITIGRRVASPDLEPTDCGDIVVLDLDSKQIISRLSIMGTLPIYKGRSRGASGIDWLSGKIYVASRTSLHVIEPDTVSTGSTIPIGYPFSFHQVKAHDGYLHIATTDRNMKHVVSTERAVDLVPTIYSGGNHKPRGCFNSVSWNPRGKEFHLYTKGILWRHNEIYNFSTGELAFEETESKAMHDLCFLSNSVVLCTRSDKGELVRIDLDKANLEVVYKTPVSYENEHNLAGFLRGILHHPESNTVFVTSGPGTLHELDAQTFKLRQTIELASSNSTAECPFDMVLDPRDWGHRGKGSF
jgi:hypothetical protein